MNTGDSASDVEPTFRKTPHTAPNADPLPMDSAMTGTPDPRAAQRVVVEGAPD